MPLENKTISVKQIVTAYNKLEPEERKAIDDLCDRLVQTIKDRRKGRISVMFGKSCALELLAKIGILMVMEEK